MGSLRRLGNVPTTIDPGLFDLIDQLAALDPKTQRKYLDSLTAPERRALDQALGQRWRRDPSTFAAHLDSEFRRWRYACLLAEKFRQAVEGESRRQIWLLPPQFGKTTHGSIWGPAWAYDRYPHLNILLASYGHTLAARNSRKVRDILKANEPELNVKVRDDFSASDRWGTTCGGQLLAAGVGGPILGFGMDVGIIDDPFKNDQEAFSQLRRDRVWDWFRTTFYSRLRSDKAAIIIVMQRLHEDDLVGRCLNPPDGDKADDWDVTRITAVAEDPDEGRNWWERLPDPLGRQVGEPIEPERFSLETTLDKMARAGSFMAASLYQQRPAPAEGSIIKRAWWRWYVSRPTMPNDMLMCWDASFKDTADGSFCVGALWARVDANFYLCDLVRDKMDYPTFRAAVNSFAAKWPQCRKILIEDKANGPAVIADLRNHVAGLVPRSPKGSKDSRVNAVSGMIESGNVWLPDPGVSDDKDVDRSFVHNYVDELAAFPHGSNDDQVDVTTMALLEWSNVASQMEPVTVTRVINDPWR